MNNYYFEKQYIGYINSTSVWNALIKECKITLDLFGYFLPEEYIEALENNKALNLELGKERLTGFALLMENCKQKIVVGQEFEKLKPEKKSINKPKELSGISAFMGKASGFVKIVTSIRHISKINRGDILIALTTTPDYVPCMTKANAIVTEGGGMLCHAAIIARELQIPTIVGVHGATTVFQDNDFVEVDAEKGIIKLLENQNKNK